MAKALVGRALALAGIVAGLLAVGLPFASGFGEQVRYLDDGTTAAFLLVLLSFASWLPAEIGRDELAAAAGAAVFGFFLFIPAGSAFDELGYLRSGAWLGLCTALIPIGALVARRDRAARDRPPLVSDARVPLVLLGFVLVVVGIWLDAFTSEDGHVSYWNIGAPDHVVGILMLVLAALNLLVLAAAPVAALPVAAATFGLVEAGLVRTAFDDLGSLGIGGWIEACAGVLLLAGVARLRQAGSAGQRS
jgi:hypothetical protein